MTQNIHILDSDSDAEDLVSDLDSAAEDSILESVAKDSVLVMDSEGMDLTKTLVMKSHSFSKWDKI